MFDKLKKKDIDLLQAYNRKNGSTPYAKAMKLAILPLSVTLLYGSVFAWQSLEALSNNNELKENNNKISSYQQKINDMGSDDYKNYIDYQEKNATLSDVLGILHSYPDLNSGLMNVFTNNLAGGMSIKTFAYDNGKFTVSLVTQNVVTIEEYVRVLRASGVFANVEYDGYQQGEQTLASSADLSANLNESAVKYTIYNFQVICTLKGGK